MGLFSRKRTGNKEGVRNVVAVFGVFDGIHDGHRSLVRQARMFGDRIVAIVARDEVVARMKGHVPATGEQERRAALVREGLADEAVLGDMEQSSYEILRTVDPDVVCFGYDQRELEKDCVEWVRKEGLDIRTYRLEAHQGEKLHNSLLKKELQS